MAGKGFGMGCRTRRVGNILGMMTGCGVAGGIGSVGCEGGENSVVVDAEETDVAGETGDVGRICCLEVRFLGDRCGSGVRDGAGCGGDM